MRVSELMTANVISISDTASLREALELMIDNRISGLTVTDESGVLVGVLTEGDLLRRAEIGSQITRPRWLEFLVGDNRLADEYVRSHAQRVSELMTREPVTIDAGATAADAAELMMRHKVRRLPVLDGGKLVGILSRADLVATLFNRIRYRHSPQLNDAEIAATLDRLLSEQKWVSHDMIQTRVKDGVVELEGVIFNAGIRPALSMMARSIPGVVQVVDRIRWMDRLSGITLPPPNDDDGIVKIS